MWHFCFGSFGCWIVHSGSWVAHLSFWVGPFVFGSPLSWLWNRDAVLVAESVILVSTYRSFWFLKLVMLVAEAGFLDCWSGRRSLFLSFISFASLVGLLGFSASRLVRWFLGFSASRLVRWLLGFSACLVASRLLGFWFSASRLLGLFRTSRLLGFWSHFWAPFARALGFWHPPRRALLVIRTSQACCERILKCQEMNTQNSNFYSILKPTPTNAVPNETTLAIVNGRMIQLLSKHTDRKTPLPPGNQT